MSWKSVKNLFKASKGINSSSPNEKEVKESGIVDDNSATRLAVAEETKKWVDQIKRGDDDQLYVIINSLVKNSLECEDQLRRATAGGGTTIKNLAAPSHVKTLEDTLKVLEAEIVVRKGTAARNTTKLTELSEEVEVLLTQNTELTEKSERLEKHNTELIANNHELKTALNKATMGRSYHRVQDVTKELEAKEKQVKERDRTIELMRAEIKGYQRAGGKSSTPIKTPGKSPKAQSANISSSMSATAPPVKDVAVTSTRAIELRLAASMDQCKTLEGALQDMATLAGTSVNVRKKMKLTTQKLQLRKANLAKDLKDVQPETQREVSNENKELAKELEKRNGECDALLGEITSLMGDLELAREDTALAMEEKTHLEVMVNEIEAVLADREAELRAQRSELVSHAEKLEEDLILSKQQGTERWKRVYHDVIEGGELLLEAISTNLDEIEVQNSGKRDAHCVVDAVRECLRTQMTRLHGEWIHGIQAFAELRADADEDKVAEYEHAELEEAQERTAHALDPSQAAAEAMREVEAQTKEADESKTATEAANVRALEAATQAYKAREEEAVKSNSSLVARLRRQRDEAVHKRDLSSIKIRDLSHDIELLNGKLAEAQEALSEATAAVGRARDKEQTAVKALNDQRKAAHDEASKHFSKWREEKKVLNEKIETAQGELDARDEKIVQLVAKYKRSEEEMAATMDVKLSMLEKLIEKQRSEKEKLEVQLQQLQHTSHFSSETDGDPYSSQPESNSADERSRTKGYGDGRPASRSPSPSRSPRGRFQKMTVSEQNRQRSRRRTCEWQQRTGEQPQQHVENRDGSFRSEESVREVFSPRALGEQSVVVTGTLIDLESDDELGASGPTYESDGGLEPPMRSRSGLSSSRELSVSPSWSASASSSPPSPERKGRGVQESLLLGLQNSPEVNVQRLMHRLAEEKAHVRGLLEEAASSARDEQEAMERRHAEEKRKIVQVMAAAKENFSFKLKSADENNARLKELLRVRSDELRQLKVYGSHRS